MKQGTLIMLLSMILPSTLAYADLFSGLLKNNVFIENANIRVYVDGNRIIQELIGSYRGHQETTVSPDVVSGHNGHGITLYTTQRCGYCRRAKEYLGENGIAYNEFDVETSKIGQQDYHALNGTGVPIILVGGERLDGYEKQSLEKMLQRNGIRD